MSKKDQEQNVDKKSSALQAGRDIIIAKGLSYEEVQKVALDVYRKNFLELSGIAADIANTRVTEITDKFLSKLLKEFPEGLDKALDPDFQYSLFTVQKEFARCGDEDLGDLLVDLLVDRTKYDQRDILQIVLNESLITAPKLTENQLAALSIIFLFKHTQHKQIKNFPDFGHYLDVYASPFIDKLVKNEACYQHLQFTGCGSVGLGSISLDSIFLQTYQGLFQKGFDKSEIEDKEISIGYDELVFGTCLSDPEKVQVKVIDLESLDKLLESKSIKQEDKQKIINLFNSGNMSNGQVKEKCVEIRPYMAKLIEIWSDSPMKKFTLTSVGIAVGHANIKRLAGEFSDLSIWIN